MKPTGLEHQQRGFSELRVSHEIISLHQEHFPELAKKMKYNPDATKVYTAFLLMLPLKVKGELTTEIRNNIMMRLST